tara:strand:+ start:4330 stop:4548 length:219 start_codon:yes stop_codon:yes gene_type:complete
MKKIALAAILSAPLLANAEIVELRYQGTIDSITDTGSLEAAFHLPSGVYDKDALVGTSISKRLSGILCLRPY